jgi:hypothetical protein
LNGISEDWFEIAEIGGQRSYRSKFSKSEFTVSKKSLQARWPFWSSKDRARFAGAFGFLQRPQLSRDDQEVLTFLMEEGDHQIWLAIALVVARHQDRTLALNFLTARIREAVRPLANFYQALEKMSAHESVPVLRYALSKDREDVAKHVLLIAPADRFFYQDYLVCSATLFKLTGEEQYLEPIREMQVHPIERIRTMVQTVSNSYGISV